MALVKEGSLKVVSAGHQLRSECQAARREPYLELHALEKLAVVLVGATRDLIRRQNDVERGVVEKVAGELKPLGLGAIIGLDLERRAKAGKLASPVLER